MASKETGEEEGGRGLGSLKVVASYYFEAEVKDLRYQKILFIQLFYS